MDCALRRQQGRVGGDLVPRNFVGLRGRPACGPHRRVHAHGLGKHLRRKLQLRGMSSLGHISAQHLARFGRKLLLYLRMTSEQVKREAQRIRRRLMPGEDDGDALIAKLPVRHDSTGRSAGRRRGRLAAAVGSVLCIDSVQQHGEQVAAVFELVACAVRRGPASFRDDPVNQFVQKFLACFEPSHGRQWQLLNLFGKRQNRERHVVHEAVDRMLHGRVVLERIHIEQALAHDAQGQLKHLRMDVRHCIGFPARGHRHRVLADHAPVRLNALAQKRRLHQPSLAHMQRLFAGQQARAKHVPRALHDNVAIVLRCVLRKIIRDQVRMIDRVDVPVERAKVHQVPMLARDRTKEVRLILAKRPTAQQSRKQRRTSRILRVP